MKNHDCNTCIGWSVETGYDKVICFACSGPEWPNYAPRTVRDDRQEEFKL